MPTKKQLSKVWGQENEFPETRRDYDPLYKSPVIPKQKVDDTDCIEIATDLYKEMQDININNLKGQSILMEYSLLISKLQKHYTITKK